MVHVPAESNNPLRVRLRPHVPILFASDLIRSGPNKRGNFFARQGNFRVRQPAPASSARACAGLGCWVSEIAALPPPLPAGWSRWSSWLATNKCERREKPLVREKPCTQKQKLDNTQGVTGTNASGSPSPTPELPSQQSGAFGRHAGSKGPGAAGEAPEGRGGCALGFWV